MERGCMLGRMVRNTMGSSDKVSNKATVSNLSWTEINMMAFMLTTRSKGEGSTSGVMDLFTKDNLSTMSSNFDFM